MSMLISVHIPKCAGTSFRHVLQALYGPRLWPNYGGIFVRSQARAELVPAGTACIHGHFFADAFDDLFPARRLVTWLRHPVERVASNYHHFLRSPDWRDDCCCALYERRLDLAGFAELDWMRNEASRYLADKPLTDFAFVGVAERFVESSLVFAAACGWPPGMAVPRENANPDRTTARYEIPAAEFDRILALNEADLRLYEQAVTALDTQRALLTGGELVAAELFPAAGCGFAAA